MIAAAFRCIAGAALMLAVVFGSASAQDRPHERRNQPGQFDFYVLSLSWSPSFCRDSEERGRNGGIQCSGRPYSFVVHGLWPQYERGFPRDCQVPAPRLNRNIMTSMLDLMPAPGLVFHEWDNHGTCSGLGPQAYFDLVRKARATVKIPEVYTSPSKTLVVTPDEVEQAFVKANPGLTREAIAVTCGSTRLSEVRICLGKDLRFRDCAEVNHNACRRNKLNMPPVRGG
ncbi:MAG TPA: ribonuclease T2 [Xanthobacteraceae bacterium]|nr:ribonuclease T2 [Xanthobacteraceae bacterium]